MTAAGTDRAPLLFVAFEQDHLVPPSVSRHNAEKYAGSQAVTEFREFPDQTSPLITPALPGVPGYEEVADYVLEWATEHATTRVEAPEHTGSIQRTS